jgi:DNA invertase Pin-like site-specific DNA recombinase
LILKRFKVPTWFFCDRQLPRQPLLRGWRKVATTGKTERGNGHRVGETHHNAKLSDHEVELIRCLREGGMKVKEIAKKFECTPENISLIVNYRTRIGVGMGVNKVFE